MKQLSTLALVAFAAACAPVDGDELPPTGVNAEAAGVPTAAPSCTSPGVCFDPYLGLPAGSSCRTAPAALACVYNRQSFEPSPKPSRYCLVASDCRRVDLRQVGAVRAVAVRLASLSNVQTWHQANCGGSIAASNNVVTDDNAVSGPVVVACCNNQCVTRR